jgi:hypothetical protein
MDKETDITALRPGTSLTRSLMAATLALGLSMAGGAAAAVEPSVLTVTVGAGIASDRAEGFGPLGQEGRFERTAMVFQQNNGRSTLPTGDLVQEGLLAFRGNATAPASKGAPTAVPLPAAAWLFASGLLGFVLASNRGSRG